jgi:hypothetical protein
MKIKLFFLILIIIPFFNSWAKTCSQSKYLVQSHPRQSYYRSDGTYVTSTTVSSYCRHYRDDGLLKEQFFRRKPKLWPHQKEKFKKFSKEKQKIISKILKSIPRILTNVGKLKIYCAKKSEVPNNPATIAPETKTIVLYHSSFKLNTKRVVVHELAHILWA